MSKASRMMPRASRIAFLALAFAGLLFVHLRLRDYAHDDAYIHFRIVRNMLTHGVPYFNPTEPVMASSSPGWPLLLWALSWLTRPLLPALDLPLLAALINSAATFGGALTYTRLLGRLTRVPLSPWAACAFFAAYLPLTIYPSLGLMETSAALLLAGLALHWLLSRRRGALFLFGILPFFRPELVVLVGLALLYATIRRIYPPWEIALFFCLGALPFVAYDLRFFGALLPHTIRAKSLVYALTFQESLGVVLTRLLDLLAPPRLLGFLGAGRPAYLFYALALVWMGLGAGVWEGGKRRRAEQMGLSGLVLAWGGATFAGYMAARALVFQWYDPLFTAPILLIFCQSLVDGAAAPLARMLRWLSLPLLGSVALILGQVAWAASVNPAYSMEFEYGARARHYLHIGHELAARCPDAVLLTPEIGALGYSFDGYLVDALGLVSPRALRYHPMAVPAERSHGGVGAAPVGLIAEVSPDLIVAYDVFVEAFLRSALVEQYVRVERPLFLADDAARAADAGLDAGLFWASRRLNIFVRADSPCRGALVGDE